MSDSELKMYAKLVEDLARKETELEASKAEAMASHAVLEKLNGVVEELQARADSLAASDEKKGETAARLQRLVKHLQKQIKSLLAHRFGRRSEKLSAEELGQLVLAWGGDPEDPSPKIPQVEESADDEAPADEAPKPKPKKRRYKNGHPGRGELSDELERIVHELPVPADARACVQCGIEMACVKHVDHERIEYVPAKLVVHIDRREVIACRQDSCQGEILTAEREAPAAPRCRIGHSLAAQMIESKSQDAMPIQRQRDLFERLGFTVPVNTLYSTWNRALDMLQIVGDAHLGEILAKDYVRVDDTGLKVLDRARKGGTRRGHLWCFVAERRVGYHFTETWEADEIAPLLFQLKGFVQVDDWKGYSSERRDSEGKLRQLVPSERRLGCGMHVRRRFYEDYKLGGKGSAPALRWFKELYEIEAYAKKKGLDPGDRLALRQEKSVPLLDAFDAWVNETIKVTRPKSRLGNALGYAKQQRPFLRRCLSDGRFEIDNGEAERQIRRPAMGRNNWLFTGSNAGGRRLATAQGLVQTCILQGIPVREYLTDVLTKIDAGWPMRRLSELTPCGWAAGRAAG